MQMGPIRELLNRTIVPRTLLLRSLLIVVLPLVPREGEAASRVLVRGIKGSRAPTRLLASRILHEADGRNFLPAFDAIFRGSLIATTSVQLIPGLTWVRISASCWPGSNDVMPLK